MMNYIQVVRQKLCWIKGRLAVLFERLLKEPLSTLTYTLIAGVIGSVIGAYFQERSWREQNDLAMLEADRKQAEAIFNEVSRLMDDRYYKTVRLLSAYKRGDAEKIERYHESLAEQLEHWNANLHRINTLLEAYYGRDIQRFFDTQVRHRMALTGNRILQGATEKKDQVYVDTYLKELNVRITRLNRLMLRSIQSDRIGRFMNTDDKSNN